MSTDTVLLKFGMDTNIRRRLKAINYPHLTAFDAQGKYIFESHIHTYVARVVTFPRAIMQM